MIRNTALQQSDIQWLDFAQHKERIRNLRSKVFIEEQGLENFMMDADQDESGLHLGLMDNGELVSVISLFIYKADHPFIQMLGIKSNAPYIVQFSRRAELKQYRSHKLATMLLAHAVKSAYDLFLPDVFLATLVGPHKALKGIYTSMYGFNHSFEFTYNDKDFTALVLNDPIFMKQLALNLRTESLRIAQDHHLHLPDLSYHIYSTPALSTYVKMEGDPTNRYLQPLSFSDELPRLSAQARMLFLTQENTWNQILPTLPEKAVILDMGCGPGVYLSQVNKLDPGRDKEFMGMDIDNQLVAYARFAHPKIKWLNGSIYETGLGSSSIDLIHTSFVFIHLTKPFLALQEIFRLLKPGGLFYISDVNDDTFEGPEVIRELVESHASIYEGDRKIMTALEVLAHQAGFETIRKEELKVINTGSDDGPRLEGNELQLGKWTMWGMFAFMGQRAEVIDKFQTAEKEYIQNQSQISINIQTYILKKPNFSEQ